MSTWTTKDIPDQTGRVFVVTGANSGLGLETTRALVDKGAYVVMACRDTDKGEAARSALDLAGPGGAEVRRLDLASLDSVREFAEGVSDWRIETLINNAGLMAVPFSRTADGFETQFGTNVLGHFALTAQLLPRLTDRVVWLSSLMHRMGRIDLADPNFERRRYNAWVAYGQSKLADLMLAYELERRLTGARSPLRSMAAQRKTTLGRGMPCADAGMLVPPRMWVRPRLEARMTSGERGDSRARLRKVKDSRSSM